MGEVQEAQLRHWLMRIGNDPELLAEDAYGRKIPLDADPRPRAFRTFCNVLVQRVCRAMGYDKLDGLTAGRIHEYCEAHWFRTEAQGAANAACEGDLAIAAWRNPDPEGHGHCAMVFPDRRLVFSGQWQEYVPKVVAVDKPVPISAGYAFAKGQKPDYFRLGRESA